MRIGDWLVEPDLLQVRRGETTHRLEPKAMRLLLYLAGAAPRVVSREEIFQTVWEGRTVVDETLTRAVSLLRQALGDNAKQPRYIETIPTKGYRLIASVASDIPESPPVSKIEAPAGLGSSTRRAWLLLFLLATIVAVVLLPRSEQERAIGGGMDQRPAIAVLPFGDLSEDTGDRYVADGLTEEVIHQLAGVAGLRVVSRTSSTRFRDTEESTERIAERLGVDYVLEGSVQAVDQEVRISARLIRLDPDEHLFSRTYDRALEDILTLQREVARDVVRETRVRLTAAEAIRFGTAATVDPEAYRLYLQGLQAIRSRTAEDFRRALALLREAVERAPDFALAWSSLADAQLLSVQYNLPGSRLEQAVPTIEQALTLDPDRAQAHNALGLLHVLRDQDWVNAEVAFRRALALEPSNATAYRRYSEMLALSGRYEEAVEQARLAVEHDPLSPLAHATYGHRLSSAKRYPEAIRELEAAEELGAKFVWHLRELSHALTRMGDEVGAAKARREDIARQAVGAAELAVLDAAIAQDGLQGYWTWRRHRLLSLTSENRFQLAEASAATGHLDDALRFVAEAIEGDIIWFLHGQRSPALDALRDDPRYLALVHGLPQWRP